MGRLFTGTAWTLLVSVFVSVPTPSLAGAVTQQVRTTVEGVQNILQDMRLQPESKRKERRVQLRNVMERRFDFADMAKRSLGPHWQARSSKERSDFVRLFTHLAEDAYADQVDFFAGERVAYLRESRDGDFAEVDTKFIAVRGDELAITYKLRWHHGAWKIYDITVENVSVVNNYRSQFSRILSGASFGDLLKKMRETRTTQLQAKRSRETTILSYWLLAQAGPNRPR